MAELVINVIGTPAPQGSKRAFVVNGRAVMAESSKKVKPWRQDVVAAVKEVLDESDWTVPPGPVRVDITFYLPRPRYHYRTGKHADQLKPTAPTWCDKKPDKDKLERATCDALTTSGVIRDDAQIAVGLVEKRYADAATGARITITPLTAAAPGIAAAAPSPPSVGDGAHGPGARMPGGTDARPATPTVPVDPSPGSAGTHTSGTPPLGGNGVPDTPQEVLFS